MTHDGDAPFGYFASGNPPPTRLSTALDELDALAKKTRSAVLLRLCLIGLTAYSETFFKDYFAAVINLLPDTVANLKTNNHDTTIDAESALRMGPRFADDVGFVLAEKYDFGSAQSINGLFTALIKITPFNKTESSIYSRIQADRNLLVHHGGTLTASYLSQMEKLGGKPKRPYSQQLDISRDSVLEDIAFVRAIGKKTANAAFKAVSSLIDKVGVSAGQSRQHAIVWLMWIDPDDIQI